jgi:peroxiredoxin Q/BCP
MKAPFLITALLCAGLPARAALKVGDPAPNLELKLTGGETASLSDYQGKWVVLYFYPKADTPGCTKQSCSLRDGYEEIRKQGAVVLGVSLDDLERQEKFKEKYELPFDLVADDGKETAKAFDVLALGGLMAKRVTFIIDPKGKIAHVSDRVDVNKHQDEVLAELKKLQKTP